MRTAQAGFKRGRSAAGPADLLVKLGPTLLVDVGHRSRAAADAPPNLPAKGVRASAVERRVTTTAVGVRKVRG